VIEKIGRVSNPLTIVAIFATITEVSGSGVLPFLTPESQALYVWFLMIFPGLLVGLFFLTLNFNHNVLYAPSDFRDESNYFKRFSYVTVEERRDKLKEEVEETRAEAELETTKRLAAPHEANTTGDQSSELDLISKIINFEGRVIAILSQEFGQPITTRAIRTPDGTRHVFDGVISTPTRDWIVEVKYLPDVSAMLRRAEHAIWDVSNVRSQVEPPFRERLGLILAVVGKFKDAEQKNAVKQRLENVAAAMPFQITLRIFDADDLKGIEPLLLD
jgi:hypothetical protein